MEGYTVGDLIKNIKNNKEYVVIWYSSCDDSFYDQMLIVEHCNFKKFIEMQDHSLTELIENSNDYYIDNEYELIQSKKYNIKRKIIYTLE